MVTQGDPWPMFTSTYIYNVYKLDVERMADGIQSNFEYI